MENFIPLILIIVIFSIFRSVRPIITTQNTVRKPNETMRTQSKASRTKTRETDPQTPYYIDNQQEESFSYIDSDVSSTTTIIKTEEHKTINRSEVNLKSNVINGIIWSEILGTPRSRQKSIRK